MSFDDLAHIPFQICGGRCAQLDRDESVAPNLATMKTLGSLTAVSEKT